MLDIPVQVQSSTPVRLAFHMMGTMSFQVVKQWACGLDHPLPTIAEIKERAELYLLPPPPLWGELYSLFL